MKKHFIDGVPRYFMPYVHDCFHNALASQLLYMGYNVNTVLTDYLSFMYEKETGYVGLNYLFKPNTTVEFTEEELNTSFDFMYFPAPAYYSDKEEAKLTRKYEDRLTIRMYIENSAEKASIRTKELIDRDIPVIAAVDLFYMPYHKYYKTNHSLHYVVITGYDEAEKVFTIFDKNRITASDFDGKISMDEMMLARNSDNKQNNSLNGEYVRPLMNIWAEVDVGDNFKVSDKKINDILSESYRRMNGEKKVLGNQCGLDMLEVFKEDLLAKKHEGLNDRNTYLFRTYYNEYFKVISRSRKRFNAFMKELNEWIPEDIINDTSEYLEKSATYWDVCANLCIKLGITKSMAVIDNMVNQLQMIKDAEQKITKNLYDCINR